MDKVVETKNHCVPSPGARLPAWCRHYAAVARCWCWVCPIGESHRAALCPVLVWRRAGRSGAAEPAPVTVVSSAGAGDGVARRLDTIYLRSMVTLLWWSAGNFCPIK